MHEWKALLTQKVRNLHKSCEMGRLANIAETKRQRPILKTYLRRGYVCAIEGTVRSCLAKPEAGLIEKRWILGEFWWETEANKHRVSMHCMQWTSTTLSVILPVLDRDVKGTGTFIRILPPFGDQFLFVPEPELLLTHGAVCHT